MKNHLMLLVLSIVLCFVNGWTVFPLPDAPAPVITTNSVKPTPVLQRFPVPTSQVSPNYLVKPTPVLPRFPVASSTGDLFPNKFNLLPKSISPILSTRDASAPALDLLPPKTEYVEYDP